MPGDSDNGEISLDGIEIRSIHYRDKEGFCLGKGKIGRYSFLASVFETRESEFFLEISILNLETGGAVHKIYSFADFSDCKQCIEGILEAFEPFEIEILYIPEFEPLEKMKENILKWAAAS